MGDRGVVATTWPPGLGSRGGDDTAIADIRGM